MHIVHQRNAQAEPTTEGRAIGTTKDVLDRHLKSSGAGDLKGILSDYAPDAVLFTPGGPLKGTDTIRPPLCEPAQS